MSNNTIPTVAEQVELATRAHASIGNNVIIAGRWYRVVRFHYEIRFFGQAKFQGENPASAHVACLRADVIKAQVLPCEYQDRELAARCEKIVAHAVAS